jgi:hypothetical protein
VTSCSSSLMAGPDSATPRLASASYLGAVARPGVIRCPSQWLTARGCCPTRWAAGLSAAANGLHIKLTEEAYIESLHCQLALGLPD